ncbi:hypothetical protein ABW42_19695, partial [Stenotrophomonas maltophilia]
MAEARGEGRIERREAVERYDGKTIICSYVLDSLKYFRCSSVMEQWKAHLTAGQRSLSHRLVAAGVTK